MTAASDTSSVVHPTTVAASSTPRPFVLPSKPTPPPASSSSSTFRRQLLCSLQRIVTLKVRDRVSLAVELSFPAIFALCLVAAWSAFPVTDIPSKAFVAEGGPANSSQDAQTLAPNATGGRIIQVSVSPSTVPSILTLLKRSLCWNETAFNGSTQPLPDGAVRSLFSPCTASALTGGYSLDHANVPIRGLVSAAPPMALLQQAFFDMQRPRMIPTVDEVVLTHWVAQTAVGDDLRSLFLRFNLPNVLMSAINGGKLHLVASPWNALFIEFVASRSVLFPYVIGATFNTYAEAGRYVSMEAPGQTWAVVEFRSSKKETASGITSSFTLPNASSSSSSSVFVSNNRSSLLLLDDGPTNVYLHMNRTGVSWTNRIQDRFVNGIGKHESRVYFAAGYLTLQALVEAFYATQVVGTNTEPPSVIIMPMPFAAYKQSDFLSVAGFLAPFVLVMSLLFTVSQQTKLMVIEKEERLKEAMYIMGLEAAPYYGAWIAVYALQNTLSMTAVAVVLKLSMIPGADFGIVWCLCALFGASVVSFAILLTSIFSKARLSSFLAPVIFFVVGVPSFVLATDTSAGLLIALSIFSPTAFGIGTKLLFQYELVTGFAAPDAVNTADTVNMFSVFVLLLNDTVVYGLLAAYFNAVMPSEWGVHKHPLFFVIDPVRWLRRRCASFGPQSQATALPAPERRTSATSDGTSTSSRSSSKKGLTSRRDGRDPNGIYEVVARGPSDEPTVRIQSVRKEFPHRGGSTHDGEATQAAVFVAVDDLCLDMYPNEITVLLGHNGAGKTTAINAMTGMCPPTSGDCFIYGHSVRRELDACRRDIGYCPQHNVLWPRLTCREHLDFFASLKGMTGEAKALAVDAMLDACDLGTKREADAGTLSGGQKRKLSVGIAFIGGSRLIIMDEPTAGMDVIARRFIWDLLRRMVKADTTATTSAAPPQPDVHPSARAIPLAASTASAASSVGRTILLTTHFMDEADVLGDQIGIMAKGSLRCSGSPAFLKAHLGVGYTLSVSRQAALLLPTASEGSAEPAAAAITAPAASALGSVQLLHLIRHHVPDASLIAELPAEVTFHLPMSQSENFAPMLAALEDNAQSLGFSGFGINATTLDEIFHSIGQSDEHRQPSALLAAASGRQQSFEVGEVARLEPSNIQVNVAAGPRIASPLSNGAVSVVAFAATPLTHYTEEIWRHRRGAAEEPQEQPSFWMQLQVLLLKRARQTRRDRRSLLITLVMPVVCAAIAIGLSNVGFPDLPAMSMSPPLYRGTLDIALCNCRARTLAPLRSSGEFAVVADVNASNGTHVLSPSLALSRYLLQTAKSRPATQDRLAAIACQDASWTITGATILLLNETYRHAAPLGLTMAFEAWMSSDAGVNVSSATPLRQQVFNAPLPNAPHEAAFFDSISILAAATAFMVPFAFVPSVYIAGIVRERECHAKHLQLISGMRIAPYWISHFIFDVASFLVSSTLVFLLLVAFERNEYIGTPESVGAMIVLFLSFGVCSVAASYAFSFAFDSHASAQNTVMMVNYFCGVLLVVVVWFLSNLESLKATSEVLRWVFRLCLPSYSLGDGIFFIASRNLVGAGGTPKAPLDWNITGADSLVMAVQAVVLLVFTWRWDQRHRSSHLAHAASSPTTDAAASEVLSETELLANPSSSGDVDVDRERAEVDMALRHEGAAAAYLQSRSIVIRGLRKSYPARQPLASGQPHLGTPATDEFVAVKNLTLAIQPREVFGFLGTNGAGKTTTLSILCGEQEPTRGDAWVQGHHVVRDADAVARCVGYCPQFDALHDLLTAKEHLELYAGLRGKAAGEERGRLVACLIELCDLDDHQSKLPGEMSGGNRRKLSVAIALIGGPDVVILDEPSAGMDPDARRAMWQLLQGIAQHSAIVLTTHHLEEVEALASRVGIMVDGELKCLGSLQHLKSTYGSGYLMDLVAVDLEGVAALKEEVRSRLSSAVLLEERHGKLRYSLPTEGTRLSHVFAILEEIKQSHENRSTTAGPAHPTSPREWAVDGDDDPADPRGDDTTSRGVHQIGVMPAAVVANDVVPLLKEYAVAQSTLESVFLRIGHSAVASAQPM